MRTTLSFCGCIALVAGVALATFEQSQQLVSKQVLSNTFSPPQVFKNINLVKTTNLDKSYPRETINVIIENIDSRPQEDYYLPFESSQLSRVAGLEVRDKKDASKGLFKVDVVEFDEQSATEFYLITLPSPLAPGQQLTLSITYSLLSALVPIPAKIGQTDKQYVQYTFSAYTPSAYFTEKQKTKVKFPNTDVPDFATLPAEINAEQKVDPQKQGSTFSYGPYNDVPAGAAQFVNVRYEFTKPLTQVTLLERDLEVSHWGGNLAIEERYWLENRGAELSKLFSRVAFQKMGYLNPATSALKELKFPLQVGSIDPYYTDDIGNVSTSRFRSDKNEALLELKPRYPIYGGWKYNFRIGWNTDLSNYLRKLSTGNTHVLKVPFLEGPRSSEGLSFSSIKLRIILPEGASGVKFSTSVALVDSKISIHKSFMDTIGRSTVELQAINLVDEFRGKELIVTYDYSWHAGLRKPITMAAGVFAFFVAAWVSSRVDVRIGKVKIA